MTTSTQITKAEAIDLVISQMTGPTLLEDVVNDVLAIWPTTSKTAKTNVRKTIKDEFLGSKVVFLDKKTLLPTQQGIANICFRVPLSRDEIKRGELRIEPNLKHMLPLRADWEAIHFIDAQGKTIPVKLRERKEKKKSLFGEYENPVTALDMSTWYKANKATRNDYLLLTILDYTACKFQVELEKQKVYRRKRVQIQETNQKVADMLFELLEAEKREGVYGSVAIPTAFVRLKDSLACPPDHWLLIVEGDPRLKYNGYEIQYPENESLLESLIPESHKPRSKTTTRKSTAEEQKHIYSFKVHLTHRKGLWRRIELQGKQTLGDFDRILKKAFNHDTYDHMSGFWRFVQRGDSQRTRKIELTTVNPFGEGAAVDALIADLGLAPNDELEYVYDFGDWIAHVIKLEEITAPSDDATYPRIAEQNRPRYKYCLDCTAKGTKTVATHVCEGCSDDDEIIYVCSDCRSPTHDDHYITEMIY